MKVTHLNFSLPNIRWMPNSVQIEYEEVGSWYVQPLNTRYIILRNPLTPYLLCAPVDNGLFLEKMIQLPVSMKQPVGIYGMAETGDCSPVLAIQDDQGFMVYRIAHERVPFAFWKLYLNPANSAVIQITFDEEACKFHLLYEEETQGRGSKVMKIASFPGRAGEWLSK